MRGSHEWMGSHNVECGLVTSPPHVCKLELGIRIILTEGTLDGNQLVHRLNQPSDEHDHLLST